ncbi:ThuA domain-containing protein [Paenibacillus sedimenti]|uniref:ThuA domain-containing protein n=1 Tax=Paenibacillus sedimenti TaxID=2770274 RepID=A0A926QMG2_9BACL|nr:ThuA domain-containing protein [Paenibacillus sedimenti]MBD0383652.1 ThuA domain-containing protein [Paenibacillus sedimenti]
MKRVVAVAGDYYHPQQLIQQTLLTAMNADIADRSMHIDFCETEHLVKVLQELPDAVILFKEDRINPQDDQVSTWMTEEIAAAIVRYVKEGGGWLAWHSGLASYSVDGAYTTMLRGYFNYHPEQHSEVTYSILEDGEANPIRKFSFMDEHYFVHCDQERTEVFLKSESKDGQAVAGWRHEEGSGRVCCLTPAHTAAGLSNAEMLDQLASCIRWCCNSNHK